MGAVDVRIGQYDDLIIAEFLYIKIVSDAASKRGDHRLDLVVQKDLLERRLFHIEDLAAQRQYRLRPPVPRGFYRAARRVSLDDIDFTFFRFFG